MEAVKTSKPFRILSLDGGGVRAIIQAVILQRIVQLYPNFLQEVDLFTGTSAGAIVAAALSVGIPIERTVAFYEQEVGKVFQEGLYSKFVSMGNTIGACYSADVLKEMLTKEIGTKTLGELSQKLLIPSFKLDCGTDGEDKQPARSADRWNPVFFHNFPHSNNSQTRIVDAVLRTTAAPTYFPICDGFIDGGVVANNPALVALSTSLASGEVKLEDIVIFSLSTGSNPRGIPRQKYGNGNWGLLEWGPHIVDLLLDSSTEAIDYQCRCLLNDRYQRIDPLLPTDIGLDNSAAVPQLKEIASQVDLTIAKKWIENYWLVDSVDEKKEDSLSLDDFKTDDEQTTPASWRCNIM